MELNLPPIVLSLLDDTVRKLVAKDYESLSQGGYLRRVSVSDLSTAVRNYGKTLTCNLSNSFSNLHVYPVVDSDVPTWLCEVELLTIEEGVSDLTLSTIVTQTGQEVYSIEITDLHVL